MTRLSKLAPALLLLLTTSATLRVQAEALQKAPAAPSADTISVSDPVVVAPNDDIQPIRIPWLPQHPHKTIAAPVMMVVNGSARYWLHSALNNHAKFVGGYDRPLKKQLWQQTDSELFTGVGDVSAALWIVNTYQNEEGVLAFIHVEHPTVTNGKYNAGRGRIALAWSPGATGDHFVYLGNIITPHADTEGYNIQGAPYLIKDGYFYVFYKENCETRGNNAVARAPVSDVIESAKADRMAQWKKYYAGGWESDGDGGACTAISIEDGINHTDAAYSTYTGKFYLLMSRMNWKGRNTYIKLYESHDILNWRHVKTIVDQPAAEVKSGYQYVSIINDIGPKNGVVGKHFYVYSGKDPEISDHEGSVLLRWSVDLAK
jgi:hypothetical protein